jgi:hypothetical protein
MSSGPDAWPEPTPGSAERLQPGVPGAVALERHRPQQRGKASALGCLDRVGVCEVVQPAAAVEPAEQQRTGVGGRAGDTADHHLRAGRRLDLEPAGLAGPVPAGDFLTTRPSTPAPEPSSDPGLAGRVGCRLAGVDALRSVGPTKCSCPAAMKPVNAWKRLVRGPITLDARSSFLKFRNQGASGGAAPTEASP